MCMPNNSGVYVRPMVVLSPNDGCAVARSEEAKVLGIKMGEPWFRLKHLVKRHGLIGLAFSIARPAVGPDSG
jgi:nucleotidyltransferase/DNA polymerase involved in DNA repair